MTSAEYAASFWAELGDAELSRPDVESQLHSLVIHAVTAWPALPDVTEPFARALARAVKGTADPWSQLQKICGVDLYLAVACLAANPGALAELERRCLPSLFSSLRRLGLNPAEVEDVAQRLRLQVLVGTDAQGGRLREYRGRGSLAGWLRICGVRMALRERTRNRQDACDEGRLAKLLASTCGAEQPYVKGVVQGAFKQALRAAILAMDARARTLLAQHYLDGMSLEAMATVYRSHRATVARWLANARRQLLAETRRRLKVTCVLSESECDSFIRDAQSRFDDTLGHALRA